MLAGVLIARTDVHVEHQSRAGHRIGVIAMARPPGLVGIVAHDRSLLTAVKRLHRRIDVENPGLSQKRLKAIIEMAPQPHRARLFLDRRKGPPHRVLADNSAHAEKLGKNFVAAQRRDMRVALVPGKHRQHRRAQHIALLGRVRARVMQRAVAGGAPRRPQPARWRRSPFARMAWASAAAGPPVLAPTTTNSTSASSGSRHAAFISMRPSGIRPRACTATPRPANAAARTPLRLLLVQAMRQVRPCRSSVSSATDRVMLGAL